MTTELQILAFSVVLGFVHIVAASHSASLQRGYRWTAGARDGELPPLSGIASRLSRASGNFLETFPFFAAAVLVAHVVGKHSTLTIWGAHLYFLARVVYLPLYAAGIPLIRSLVWNVAFIGIVLILVALFRI
jgi:uncharacterized MAPEG superfamily protein